VKGVLAPEDVGLAREAGADAIVVSNHGGRQIDGVPAPISILEEVVATAGPSIEVILDGGVRRGTDVIKALSIGAKAVMVGRPYLYGLAAAGQPGVERVLAIFREEIARTLTLMGCEGATSLSPHWLRPCPPEVGRPLRASPERASRVELASGEGHLL
jgi:isopentenyl diphosphate isomerase/L-lactate dehydrogenase-like FMN-dependent dehydrogenase